MKYRIKDESCFISTVFGADDLLKYFPELKTTGVELHKIEHNYYIIKNGKLAHDTAFFTNDEMNALEEIT